MKSYLSEAYDHDEEYQRDIQPLVDELHNKLTALNLPFVLNVCTAVSAGEDGDVRIRGAVHLNGRERTPRELMFAHAASKGVDHLMGTVRTEMLRELMGGESPEEAITGLRGALFGDGSADSPYSIGDKVLLTNPKDGSEYHAELLRFQHMHGYLVVRAIDGSGDLWLWGPDQSEASTVNPNVPEGSRGWCVSAECVGPYEAQIEA